MKYSWTLPLLLTGIWYANALEPVTYSALPRKAVAVPAAAVAPVVDGVLDDAGWQEAGGIQDFFRYKNEGEPEAETRVSLLRHGAYLYLGIQCMEPGRLEAGNREDGFAVWQGDAVELFFGALEPKGWCRQFVVGAGGGRFADSGDYDTWEAKTSADGHGWYAEVKIPLQALTAVDSGIGFNLCRQRQAAGECFSWGPVRHSFHEPENFGEILLTDYDSAALARFGETSDTPLDRAGYERFAAQRTPMATAVKYGPYLSNPTATGITVNWETAGQTAAFVEYRESGSAEWLELPVALANGLVRSDRKLHVADLEQLKPGTKYEYRLGHLASSATERVYAPGGSFTTLSPERKRYRFAAFSDIHSDSKMLERLWRNSGAEEADFCFNLGDMLSSLNGPGAFFQGFLDMETELFAKERPLVFVRGNHELRGFFAGGYFDYMRHPSGKSYYSFSHGPVCFVVLDGGTDGSVPGGVIQMPEFLAQQRAWLAEVVASEAFRQAQYRIVLLHFPMCDMQRSETQTVAQLIAGLLDGTEPERRIHLMLGGHMHEYFRINPEAAKLKTLDGHFSSAELPRLPFTVVANDGPGDGGVEGSILSVDVTEEALAVKAFGADGDLLDSFRVLPDASVEE